MGMQSLIKWIPSLQRKEPIVLKPAEFQASLSKERARSDRNGHGFSVAVFRLSLQSSHPKIQQVARFISDQIRNSDEFGWYDDEALGVLLYNTPSNGAWSFVDNVRPKIDELEIPHACSVFSYPENWDGCELDNNSQLETDRRIKIMAEKDHGVVARTGVPRKSSVVGFANTQSVWKRIIDIIGALFAIVMFSPVLLVTGLLVKLTSQGPVLFKQKRAGIGGKAFDCLKFRSMCVDAEEQKKELLAQNERTGPVFKMSNDPRVTKVGHYIRQWSIDELPQFFNVLKGEMSLVGPRPPTIDEVEKYDHWHNNRLDVKPGITCIWQVYARHDKCFENWVRLDIKYIRKQSFWYDFKILFMTIPAVVSRKGAC